MICVQQLSFNFEPRSDGPASPHDSGEDQRIYSHVTAAISLQAIYFFRWRMSDGQINWHFFTLEAPTIEQGELVLPYSWRATLSF